MNLPYVPDLDKVIAGQPYPLLFVTVSGAHLYGFPSADSDVDLRGVHLLPAAGLLGLQEPDETRTHMWWHQGVELDLVSHDLRKFVRLMLRRNGYVLEQLLSPLVAHTTGLHADLATLAPGVITSNHAHHYQGFATTQQKLFEKTGELKPLLYTFRALLTGIHLMRTGEVLAHLPSLIEVNAAPDYLVDLIVAKTTAEHGVLRDPALTTDRLATDIANLYGELDQAQADTALPAEPTGFDALHDLIVRARLNGSER